MRNVICSHFNLKGWLISAVLLSAMPGGTLARPATEVMPPWTPVTVKRDAAGTEVSVWGRSHTFACAALPSSIKTEGNELLAAPVRLVGQVGGKPLEWRAGGNLVLSEDNAQATVSGWQSCDEVTVNTTTRIEFDGMVRIDLTVMPQYRKAPKLERLWLEIPLKRALVGLYHYYPGNWGSAVNSGATADTGLVLPFKPFVWFGNEKEGLGWFAESDKGWQPHSADRVIELLPQGQESVLRIRLSDSETKLPATFTFGLQATPVKPWPKGFHEKRIWHASELGVGITLPVPKEWWLCHRAFPDRKPLPKLDRAQELGVKTVVFHEDWLPVQNYPVTCPEAEFKGLVDACHQRGMKVLVYQGIVWFDTQID
jgi:hypothetical protein